MHLSTPTTTTARPPSNFAHGCWEILIHLTSVYPVHSLGDLMRVTRLAEQAYGRGLGFERPARDR